MRLPDGNDLHAFCRADGWEPVRETNHTVYRKTLADGAVLTTLVSHGNKQIGDANLFVQKICSKELQCTAKQFWAAVDQATPVPRPQPEVVKAEDPIPYGLVRALLAQGHSMDRVQKLHTKVEALELLRHGPP